MNACIEWVDAHETLPDDDMTVLVALDDGEVWTGIQGRGRLALCERGSDRGGSGALGGISGASEERRCEARRREETLSLNGRAARRRLYNLVSENELPINSESMENTDVTYKTDLCLRMMVYAAFDDEHGDLRPSQVRDNLSVFFSGETIKAAESLMREGVIPPRVDLQFYFANAQGMAAADCAPKNDQTASSPSP